MPEIRSFAITLHFYSPRAYEYIRNVFGKKLPAQRTLRKWCEGIDGSPGCSSEALTAIKLKIREASSNNKHLICNLVMDEMAIRKHINYDHIQKKYFGYVDFGNKLDNNKENRSEAKEALVFLINAVNDRWKLPVAYFLVNGLNSTEKTDIFKEVLVFLSDVDITISSVTFDGAASNFAMCRALGAKIEPSNIQASFQHPVTKQPVFLLLDICHMLKLVRNTLASKVILDGEGNMILWSYIDKLEKMQAADGVLLANKLRDQHINFGNQKMKTKLAAQTISCSVAALVEYLKMGHQGFKDCGATIKFIRTFNNLFDILNSKNKFGKMYKKPLNPQTASEIFEYFDEALAYIHSLKIKTEYGQRYILESQSRTGFIGFVIGLTNFKNLFNVYCRDSNRIDYLLAYKFSQDHIATFFSAIRSRGGFNNNPTAMQFASAYLKDSLFIMKSSPLLMQTVSIMIPPIF